MATFLLDASALLAREDPSDQHHVAMVQIMRGASRLSTLDLAFYEVTNVAIRAWKDRSAARRLHLRIDAIGDDGGIVRARPTLLAEAAELAEEHEISAYDAAYVVAARHVGAQLVSCDVRDLVSRGLAILPEVALRSAD